MPANILIKIGDHQWEAEIFATPTGRAILDTLPFTANAITWGDEIYFGVRASAALEPGAKEEVRIGDLAYWPSMPAFCIFFGPTPASMGQEPRAASAVNVFGRLLEPDPEVLRKIGDGEKIRISLL